MIKVLITQLEHGKDLPLPTQMSTGASGFDLCAAINDPLELKPGERTLIPTGIGCAMPNGIEGQVRPRSGLALKHGLTVLNTPGTIDADYRGEIGVILINLGDQAIQINRGDRIAQLVFQQVSPVQLEVVTELETTSRGTGGFGHTGK